MLLVGDRKGIGPAKSTDTTIPTWPNSKKLANDQLAVTNQQRHSTN